MSSPPKFEDIGVLHLAREVLEEQSSIINHQSNGAWQLARDLTRKVNGRKVTLNGEP